MQPPPSDKVTPLFSSNPPLKTVILSTPLTNKNLVRGSTPLMQKGGMHTMEKVNKLKDTYNPPIVDAGITDDVALMQMCPPQQ